MCPGLAPPEASPWHVGTFSASSHGRPSVRVCVLVSAREDSRQTVLSATCEVQTQDCHTELGGGDTIRAQQRVASRSPFQIQRIRRKWVTEGTAVFGVLSLKMS